MPNRKLSEELHNKQESILDPSSMSRRMLQELKSVILLKLTRLGRSLAVKDPISYAWVPSSQTLVI